MSKWHKVMIDIKRDETLDIDILLNLNFQARRKIKTILNNGNYYVMGKFKSEEDAMAFKLAFENNVLYF